MNLTKNFTLEEMLHSDTAAIKHIKNTTDDTKVIENLRLLCENILQPIRDFVGRPVIVTSGYRSPQVNKLVGGSKTSQHLTGQAADILIKGYSRGDMQQLFRWIQNSDLPFDQLISEGVFPQSQLTGHYRNVPWIHISFGPRNRRQVLYS